METDGNVMVVLLRIDGSLMQNYSGVTFRRVYMRVWGHMRVWGTRESMGDS